MLGRHVHEKRDFDHGGFGIQNRSQKSRAMVLALCMILNVEDLHEITQKGERPHNGHLVRILLANIETTTIGKRHPTLDVVHEIRTTRVV